MEPKFTKGPWHTDEKEHDDLYQDIKVKGGYRIVCTIWIDDAPLHEYNAEQSANALLIAAAPELYEALEAVKEYSKEHGFFDADVITQAIQALRKARGEA